MKMIERFACYSSHICLGDVIGLDRPNSKGVIIGCSDAPKLRTFATWYGGNPAVFDNGLLERVIDEELKYGYKFYQIAVIEDGHCSNK